MEFVDRQSKFPNRYTITDENGNESTVYLKRADEPTIEGTPLNAETFNSLSLYSEDSAHPGCYYRIADGEIEWLNPPMILGESYRTTKRYNGVPVYTTAIQAGTLGEAGTYILVTVPGIGRIVDFSTKYYNGSNVFPDPMVGADGIEAYSSVVAKNILRIWSIREGLDYRDYVAFCIIEYTKDGE